jgi:hypothetical protein
MTNKYFPLTGLGYTETKDFELVIQEVCNDMLPSGLDTMYALRNKITGIIEARGMSLALSVVVLQNQQQMFDKVLSGELNGYASPQGKTALGDIGDI